MLGPTKARHAFVELSYRDMDTLPTLAWRDGGACRSGVDLVQIWQAVTAALGARRAIASSCSPDCNSGGVLRPRRLGHCGGCGMAICTPSAGLTMRSSRPLGVARFVRALSGGGLTWVLAAMTTPVLGFNGTHYDSVRVLALGSPPLRRSFWRRVRTLRTGVQWEFQVLREAECSRPQSEEVVTLWNGLPEAEQSRCHIPGFAIQLLQGSKAVFTAALCWQCNNVSFAGDLASIKSRRFDGESVAAKDLLQLCRSVVGIVG